MNSLDPRVKRLPIPGEPGKIIPKVPLDQFGSFEVFVQPKEGKPFQHEGIVHAPNLELAYVLAKEAFTRRFTCTSLYVTDTRNVFVSPTTDGNVSAYEQIASVPASGKKEPFEIYHLAKRGKQHVHAGTVEAGGPEEAMSVAKQLFNTKVIYNVWAVRKADIRFTHPDELDLWNTLPEKRFRDAADYKGGDKLKEFLEKQRV
ncbi:MAG: phenylacetic acid degradation b [Cyclobacteriaceae bacterium]|nr:phenylacetic acid degradation b [Cyclobacteriaceae bacterium]